MSLSSGISSLEEHEARVISKIKILKQSSLFFCDRACFVGVFVVKYPPLTSDCALSNCLHVCSFVIIYCLTDCMIDYMCDRVSVFICVFVQVIVNCKKWQVTEMSVVFDCLCA